MLDEGWEGIKTGITIPAGIWESHKKKIFARSMFICLQDSLLYRYEKEL